MTRQIIQVPEGLHRRLAETWSAEPTARSLTFNAWLDCALKVTMYEGGERHGHPEFDWGPMRTISLPNELADYMCGYAEARLRGLPLARSGSNGSRDR